MTERRADYGLPSQMDLFGTEVIGGKMTRDQKCAYVMERFPETRDDDRLLMLRYWQVFDRLDAALGPEAWSRFCEAFQKATHPETIRRGRAGIQQLRTGTGSLRPSPHEAERRRALDGAGPPDRGRW